MVPSSHNFRCRCFDAWWWVFVSICHAFLTTPSFQVQLLLTVGYWPIERKNCEGLPAVTSLHNSRESRSIYIYIYICVCINLLSVITPTECPASACVDVFCGLTTVYTRDRALIRPVCVFETNGARPSAGTGNRFIFFTKYMRSVGLN